MVCLRFEVGPQSGCLGFESYTLFLMHKISVKSSEDIFTIIFLNASNFYKIFTSQGTLLNERSVSIH